MREAVKNLTPIHMMIIGIAVFAVVVVIACGVRAAIDASAPEVDDSVSELTIELVEDVELSELQSALLAAESNEDAEVRQLLELNLWTAGSTTARFGQAAVAEVAADGQIKTRPFVLSQTKKIDKEESGGKVEGWTGQVYLSDSPSDYTLKRVANADNAPYVLECEALSLAQSYQLAEKSDTFEVVGLEQESLGIFDEETKANIEEVVEQECSKFYPLATAAVWDGCLEIDYDDAAITLNFDIEGAGSVVTVSCSLSRVVESVEASTR